jgi:hypothetical protein
MPLIFGRNRAQLVQGISQRTQPHPALRGLEQVQIWCFQLSHATNVVSPDWCGNASG